MKQEEASRSDVVLAQLAEGTAWFEFVETCDFEPSNAPFASLSSAFSRVHKKEPFWPCFAKIRGIRLAPEARAKSSPASNKKIEYFTVRRVFGDGRCMFRALVLGMAANKGASLNSYEEENEAGMAQLPLHSVEACDELKHHVFCKNESSRIEEGKKKRRKKTKEKEADFYDQLRLAVMDALCTGDKRTQKYEEALIAITVEESLARYCERIPSSRFWGGESELLVLSRMCNQPIMVYIPESEAKRGGRGGGGYLQIAEYGSEFKSSRQGEKARNPVRLLYSGSNHYDLLM